MTDLNELFDSFAKNIERTDIGKTLRRGIEDLARHLPELSEAAFGHPRPHPPIRTAEPPTNDAAWSAHDLRCQFYNLALTQNRIGILPKSIDLAAPGPAMARMSSQAQDGKEYGRVCYLRRNDGRMEMGDTSKGSPDRVAIPFKITPDLIPVIMLHTHPPINGNALSPCHFSEQDFRSFLDFESLLASIVITPRASLMMVKTRSTPSIKSIAPGYLESFFTEAASDSSVSFQSIQARATQRICRSLGLGLYIRKNSSDTFFFDQVNLK